MLEFNEFDVRSYRGWQPRGPLVATRCYGGGGKAPQPESYYNQITGELQAKSQLAPQMFGTEATFDPAYAALNNQLLQDTMFGTPNGTSITYPTPGYDTAMNSYNQAVENYNAGAGISGLALPGPLKNLPAPPGPIQKIAAKMPGPLGKLFGRKNVSPNQPPPVAPNISPTTTINLPASRGIVSLANQAGTEQRIANIADWSSLSPEALATIKRSNPDLANLIDTQVNQAQTNLGLGTNLSPSQMAQLEQTIRARQQGMLGGTGNAGTYGEALGISQYGQGLYQQRLQNANLASSLAAGYYTPQLNQLMTQNYNPFLAVQQSGVQNSAIGPRLFGSDINAQNAYTNQYQGALSSYNAQQNNQAAMTSAGISGGVGLASAGLLALALA